MEKSCEISFLDCANALSMYLLLKYRERFVDVVSTIGGKSIAEDPALGSMAETVWGAALSILIGIAGLIINDLFKGDQK